MNVKEREIIEDIIEQFRRTKDYQMKKNEYLVLISKIKSQAILQLIKELEELIGEKNSIEFDCVYLEGKSSQKRNRSSYSPESKRFDFGTLNQTFNYSRLLQRISELKQKIIKSYRAVNNFQHIDVVNSIFQIYDSLSDELCGLIYTSAQDKPASEKGSAFKCIGESDDLSMIAIGRKMHYCRKALNYTQKEMGIMFNLDRTIISNYENGKYLPSLNFVIQFAKYLDINLEDLCYIDFDIKMFEVKYPPAHFVKNAG